MKRFARSKTWIRAAAVMSLALSLVPVPPAGARDLGRPLPLPPPGKHLLIRIGPQALVSEDDQGRVRMVDEPPPAAPRGKAVTDVFRVLGVGAVLILDQNDLFFGNQSQVSFGSRP